MPVAGRSPRASCPQLTRCRSRFAILAALDQQRRLSGTGSPSLPLVAQVVNLCASLGYLPRGAAHARTNPRQLIRSGRRCLDPQHALQFAELRRPDALYVEEIDNAAVGPPLHDSVRERLAHAGESHELVS